jgi:hypothetical protein
LEWYREVRQKFLDVYEEGTASVFRIEVYDKQQSEFTVIAVKTLNPTENVSFWSVMILNY